MDGGTKVHSAVLRYQGEIIAKEGVKAFDVAFHYLNDDRVHMRWIAVDVLGRITGKRPLWYLYGKPGQVFQGDPDWSDRAKKEWTKWKTEQPGGDQPATKPVDKPPAKDQPLTPTSKDIAR